MGCMPIDMTLTEITTLKFVTGIQQEVFWVVAPSSVTVGYQVTPPSSELRWRWKSPLKYLYPTT